MLASPESNVNPPRILPMPPLPCAPGLPFGAFSVARPAVAPAFGRVGRARLGCLRRIATAALVAFFVGYPAWVAGAELPTVSIVGHVLPAHIVEKYHQRFVAAATRAGHPPTAAEDRQWLDDFIAKQVVIEQALAAGYGNRPEVIDVVARMERTVLTNPDGPLARHDPAPPIDAAAVAAALASSQSTVDAAVVRFDSPEAADAALGTDFSRLSVSQQWDRVQALPERGLRVIDGNLPWPFQPVEELGDLLIAAPQHRWVRRDTPGGACAVVFIRSRQVAHPATGATPPPGFRRFLELKQAAELRERRHDRMRRTAEFTFQLTTAHALTPRLARLPSTAAAIPVQVLDGVADAPLFRYREGSQRVTVTAGAFAAVFNGRFVRELPRNLVALRSAAEEMMLEALDVAAARRLGLDRTPNFVEDREGFRRMQVLEVYEREVLIPRLRAATPPPAADQLRPALDALERTLAAQWQARFPVTTTPSLSAPALTAAR